MEKRINAINKIKKTKKPDILFIIETHTFYEEYKKIKEWSEDEQYQLIYKADSQKNQYELIKTKN